MQGETKSRLCSTECLKSPPAREIENRDEDEQGQQNGQRVLEQISEKPWCRNFRLFGYRFNHEIWPIADVGHSAEEHGAQRYGDELVVMGRGELPDMRRIIETKVVQ